MNRLNLQAATADLEKAKNDISMQVAQAYVQVLYNMEILEVARRQIVIDSTQVARQIALYKAGKTSQAELSQQQSTLAQSQLTVTQADNTLRLSLLTLSQLLELPSPEGFSVVRPTNNDATLGSQLPLPDAIFAEAVASRPEIEAENLRLKATEKSLAISKAGYYPNLSLSAGLGSNYYTTSGMSSGGFTSQLKNNFSQYIGLNLSIPIFDRFSTRNNVRSARINIMGHQLTLDNTKKQLYKEIQQVYYNTVAARQKLTSSTQARQTAEDAFTLMTAKYEQGKANITEFNESKNNYLKAESDLTQARYELLYQMALLQFYRGEKLQF